VNGDAPKVRVGYRVFGTARPVIPEDQGLGVAERLESRLIRCSLVWDARTRSCCDRDFDLPIGVLGIAKPGRGS